MCGSAAKNAGGDATGGRRNDSQRLKAVNALHSCKVALVPVGAPHVLILAVGTMCKVETSSGSCRSTAEKSFAGAPNSLECDGRRGSLFCNLAKRIHDAHHVNLYSLEDYRVSLICLVSN